MVYPRVLWPDHLALARTGNGWHPRVTMTRFGYGNATTECRRGESLRINRVTTSPSLQVLPSADPLSAKDDGLGALTPQAGNVCSDESVKDCCQTGNNQAPFVNAGANQTINLLANAYAKAYLEGRASDDGLPAGSLLSVTWSKVSGPRTVVFVNDLAPSTTAVFSAPGTYVLRLTASVLRLRASDTSLTSTSEMTITVNPPSTIPGLLPR